ncbi:unnamed protein product [marine sediment metagenome]|uniref:Uncharacterized protein n=1 Tax=marine sediment metagenome TaxID=412755 RepID=X1D961_9ZZZZ
MRLGMSEDLKKVKLSTGTEVEFDDKAPKSLFEIIISDILIPKYKENADWNLSLNIIIEEMNKLIVNYDLSPKLKLGLLNQVEEHLDKDIEELTGVDKSKKSETMNLKFKKRRRNLSNNRVKG